MTCAPSSSLSTAFALILLVGISVGCPHHEPPPGTITVLKLPDGVPLEMVWVPAGSFTMGSSFEEQDRLDDEGPQHEVTLTSGYWIGKYTVTKKQWAAVMGSSPWEGQPHVLDAPNSPAVYISWMEAQDFIAALNNHIVSTGQGLGNVRLPSEAEWEYAARAGTTTRFYWGNDPDYTQIEHYAFYRDNGWGVGNKYAHVVGQKIPNSWGLYDTSGNVWEWCQDWYGGYSSGSLTDPKGPPTGSQRILRGGAWDNEGFSCRSAYRYAYDPALGYDFSGFRIVFD